MECCNAIYQPEVEMAEFDLNNYDENFKHAMQAALLKTILETSRMPVTKGGENDTVVIAFRTMETAKALTDLLAWTLAQSPYLKSSPTKLRENIDLASKRLLRLSKDFMKEPDLASTFGKKN
jgi:hypothetical protein